MKRLAFIVAGFMLMAALMGGFVGYTIRAAMVDYNDTHQYCKVSGMEAWPKGGNADTSYQFNQQYHVTCKPF